MGNSVSTTSYINAVVNMNSRFRAPRSGCYLFINTYGEVQETQDNRDDVSHNRWIVGNYFNPFCPDDKMRVLLKAKAFREMLSL